MNKNIYLILFMLLTLKSFAQNNLKGQVVDATTNEPLLGVSVFINNSTLGNITDASGNFTINNISSGKHELIVSMVGYHKFSSVIEVPHNQKLLIKINEKANELEAIVVNPYEINGWEKWGKVFLETFIGTNGNAEKTKLKNHKDLRFRYYQKDKILEVSAVKPLIIENKSLGYDLEYHLELFQINYKNNSSLYAGFPLFKEKTKISKSHLQNREKTYNASLMKFIRSVYHDSVEKDGYIVRILEKKENAERKRVQNIYNRYTLKDISTGETLSMNLPEDIYTADSLKYFNKILAQPKEVSYLHKTPLKTDTLIQVLTDGTKLLSFKNFLHVVNTQHKEEKKYLEYNRYNREAVAQTSMLKMLEDEDVEIQANGSYFPPLNLMTLEYWSWSNKIADLLPLNYKL